jgi:hypothetical protein
MIVFSKSAHSPFVEEPKAFFNYLKEFVESITAVPPEKLQEYSLEMKIFKPSIKDEFLTKDISTEETESIKEFQKIKTRISEGEKYFDLSSPLDVQLSFLSAIKHRDLISARKIQDRDWTLKELSDDDYWFNKVSIWRVPAPPKRPKSGQIWPIYITNTDTGEWMDTLLFIYWDGQWQRYGNEGMPYLDWRNHELNILKGFLKRIN